MQFVFGCPKGREVGLSGGPFAWASSVDGKLRSERLARAGLLLLTTHYTKWEFSTSGNVPQVRIFYKWECSTSENFPHMGIFHTWEFSTSENFPQVRIFHSGNVERDATSSPGCEV